MLSKEKAIAIAANYIKGKSTKHDLVLLTNNTIEFELGWVFFYQSKKYIDSGDYRDMLGGNAPIIINKYNGSVHVTGTSYAIEKYIKDYLNTENR